MGHNMELYCTQPTVRRGVEKQIKLQQTCGMQIAERGRTRVCQPTRPLNRCKISTGSWRQCSGGEERCSLLERGRVCWAIGWSTAQCWVPCSLYILCFSIQCVDRKRRDLKVTLTGVWNGHRGRRQCRDDTSCELFHIWAIINHGLRLGKRPQGGRPCGAGAVTCLLTDERSDPPTSPQWPLNP